MKRSLTSSFLFFFGLLFFAVVDQTSSAQELDPADYENVLIPVFFFGDGAHDSRWQSSLTVYNDGETTVHFACGVLNGDPVCDGICGCGVRDEILPDETNEVCPGLSHFSGLILYPSRELADSLAYRLFVRDRSRDRLSAGTEVPVIRERDLRSKVILLRVPVEDRFRTTLRVYDAQGRGGLQVRMQIFEHGSTARLLVDENLTLIQHLNYFAPEPFPGNPSIATVNVRKVLEPDDDGPDEVAGPSDRELPSLFRIELTPLAPLERFWAFVSVTSDETNEVTTITP